VQKGNEPNYEASQLCQEAGQGWHSHPSASFPQELIFQFTDIVHLNQLHLLSH
jgi:hypothetical protein